MGPLHPTALWALSTHPRSALFAAEPLEAACPPYSSRGAEQAMSAAMGEGSVPPEQFPGFLTQSASGSASPFGMTCICFITSQQ